MFINKFPGSYTQGCACPAVQLVGAPPSAKLTSVEVIFVNKTAFNFMAVAKMTRDNPQVFS